MDAREAIRANGDAPGADNNHPPDMSYFTSWFTNSPLKTNAALRYCQTRVGISNGPQRLPVIVNVIPDLVFVQLVDFGHDTF